jgi:O-antigen ligase
MTLKSKYKSKLRIWLTVPFVFALTAYSLCLPTYLVGMEIAAWSAFVLFLIYVLIDRLTENRQVEFYALGIEFPLAVFIITVICGLKMNSATPDFFTSLGNIRNFILIFIFCYGLQIYKNLNRLFTLMIFTATVVSGYAIWQHFTGLDPIHPNHLPIEQLTWGSSSVFAARGLFRDRFSFGYTFLMLICLPWAALLFTKKIPWWQTTAMLISFLTILVSLIFTYTQGVWIALLITLPIMAFFASRKFFTLSLLIVAIACAAWMKKDPSFKEKAFAIFADTDSNVENRKKLWDANMAMFHDHPWIGVGYQQNESLSPTYFEKLNIKDGVAGHAHSNYIELMSTTGILGFASFMIFIMGFLLMTSRLLTTIPSTHYWHKVFALTALGAQIASHVGGLTQWNFGIPEVQHLFFFFLAVVGYMSQRYYAHIVPDDQSL